MAERSDEQIVRDVIEVHDKHYYAGAEDTKEKEEALAALDRILERLNG